MTRLLALLLALASAGAHAQWLDSKARLFLSGGGAGRNRTQNLLQEREVAIGDLSPTNLHLSGGYFFHPNFGLGLEGRGELFYACCNELLPTARADGQRVAAQPAFDLGAAAVGRLRPARWLGLELHLGAQVLMRSGLVPPAVPGQRATVTSPMFFAPVVTGAVVVAPWRAFQVMLFLRGFPVALPLTGERILNANTAALGLQASIGALRLGPLQLGFAPTLELASSYALSDSAAGVREFTQLDLRGGLGVTLQQWVDEPEVVRPTPGNASLSGRVVLLDGAAAAGARVKLDGVAETKTDAQGSFTFAAVAPGPHQLEARKDGFTGVSAEVSAPLPAPLVLSLGAPTGPGRITGVVKQPDGPLAGATVTAVEANQSVQSAADGSYALEKVGPGPVTVRVKAVDFSDAEEVAQVAPGGTTSLDFPMNPKAVAVRATLRGLVRAKGTGEAVKATVRVVELKLKLQVKPDGRFSAEVPSGKYTLVIEARGYLTQTKTVEVSGGDQAIFHTELERAR